MITMKTKVLHLFIADKFTKPLIPFLNSNFGTEDQLFLGVLDNQSKEDFEYSNVKFLASPLRKHFFKNLFLFYTCCKNADKIVMHGSVLNHFFLFFPFFLRKTYWIIMGSELYTIPNNTSLSIRIRKFVLSRVSHHVTHIEGDSALANQILCSKAALVYSPLYLSNTVTTEDFEIKQLSQKEKLHVLVGNSLSRNNNHFQIFQWLKDLNDNNIKVFVPLSYGNDKTYQEEVIERGREIFKENFYPITEFMTMESYRAFLKNMDIAIFNHSRQEALGVTLTLLSLGKLVYVNPNTTSYQSLIKKGLKVFDNQLLRDSGLRKDRDVSPNKVILEKFYSTSSLLDSYKVIYQ